MMNLEKVKSNLNELVGKEFEYHDMIEEIGIAFEDYSFKGSSFVQVSMTSDTTWSTYVDHEDAPEIRLHLGWRENEQEEQIYWIIEVDC